VIDSAAALLFGAGSGAFAVGLAWWSRTGRRVVMTVVRRVVLSVWPLIAAAWFAWVAPERAMEPVVTALLFLFGLAALLARFGPAETRRAALAFAVVGLFYLALVYGPGGAEREGWSPSHRVCQRLTGAWFPPDVFFGRPWESYAAGVFQFLGGGITAWFLALAAGRLVWSLGRVPGGQPQDERRHPPDDEEWRADRQRLVASAVRTAQS
jgi:hypothetical protein